MMKTTVCVAGKNNIAVSLIEYIKTHYQDINLIAIPDRNDNGIDGWQRSVKKYCNCNNISIVNLDDVYELDNLVFISAEFDRIIRPDKFKSNELFNIHFSLLPKYKGMFTSVLPILNGDNATGVTLHIMRAGIDTGEIIDQKVIPIEDNMTSYQLYNELIKVGTKVVLRNLPILLNGNYIASPQDAKGSSYFGMGYIDYKNIILNVNSTADQIKNQVYAFAFRPYQLLSFDGVKIIGAKVTNAISTLSPGTVIKEDKVSILIATIDYDILLYKDVLLELNNAIMKCDNAKAQELCAYAPIVNDKEKHGWTPLAVAIYNNNFEMAKYLLSLGADEFVVNNNGTTLLMYAKDAGLRTGEWDIFRWLIGLGLNIHTKDYSGKEIADYVSEKQLNALPFDIKSLIAR